MGMMTRIQSEIFAKQEEQRMLRHWYTLAAQRRIQLRKKQVHPSREALKATYMKRYDLMIKDMCDRINELSDEIFLLEKKERESK